jgi:hypothetical protein
VSARYNSFNINTWFSHTGSRILPLHGLVAHRNDACRVQSINSARAERMLWPGLHTRCFPGRAGLQAWVKQQVHAYCAAAPLATTGAWCLLLKNRSHADLVWAVLSMLSLLGDVAAHGGRLASTRDGIGGSPVHSGVRSPPARTTPCPLSMRLTRRGRPQAWVASAQSTPGRVARPCRLSPPRARAAHAWTARRSTRRGRQPSHTSRGTPCRGVHGPRTLVESDRVCDTARNEAHAS